jgi:uncharacterized SAM-binding protein YcdF (DUF218 family)
MYLLRWILTLTLSLAAAWLIGLLIFVGQVQVQRAPVDPTSEGIVVLTGGEGRVVEGLRLLTEMKGSAMLISGVHPEATKDSIINAQDIDNEKQQHLLKCCVDLGYAAGSTVGNADEAAKWSGDRKLKSLLIVTSAYHIPRARLEFAQAFANQPNVQLEYYPMAAEKLQLGTWWQAPISYIRRFPGTAQLIVREYVKYLFALGRTAVRWAA